MLVLWRAADDDYVDQGYSFTPDLEAAQAYLDNPGYGGAYLWQAVVDPVEEETLDWRDMSVGEAVHELGFRDPGATNLDEWLPRTPAALDALRDLGYLWVRITETYPANTETWLWLGRGDDLDVEPELFLVEEES